MTPHSLEHPITVMYLEKTRLEHGADGDIYEHLDEAVFFVAPGSPVNEEDVLQEDISALPGLLGLEEALREEDPS